MENIQKGKDLQRKGIRWNVGNGDHIKIWNDPWIPLSHNFSVSPVGLVPNDAPLSVASLIDRMTLQWDLSSISNLVSSKDLRRIYKIPLSMS